MLSTTFAYFTSTQDWLIIGVIVLVLFGSTKIPQFAKGIGEGIREFKKSVTPGGPDDTGGDTSAFAAKTPDTVDAKISEAK